VSGISGDMHTLLASEDPRARRAIDLYPYRIRRELSSLTAALGKVDAIVFTAGTGANAQRPSHQHHRRPGAGMGDAHQRGIDDRTPHPAHARLNINGALSSFLAWFERPKQHIAGKQAQNDGERSGENVGEIR
jgi:hypothetical protein